MKKETMEKILSGEKRNFRIDGYDYEIYLRNEYEIRKIIGKKCSKCGAIVTYSEIPVPIRFIESKKWPKNYFTPEEVTEMINHESSMTLCANTEWGHEILDDFSYVYCQKKV